jgi:hypothetical protein
MMVTFQDMTSQLPNPEEGIEVGCFVLNCGGNGVYIPAVSVAQTMQPLDSIFLADKSQFFPLTNKVIKWISSTADSGDVGKSKGRPSTVKSNPTVEQLVNPPRTGKFVYASTSRFQEFLASLPNNVKERLLEAFTSSPLKDTLYNSMKSYDGVITMLKTNTPDTFPRYQTHEELWPHSLNMVTYQDNYIPSAVANQVLQDGYAFIGDREQTRYAVEEGFPGGFNQLGNTDTRGVFPIVFKDGSVQDCYLPRKEQTGSYMNFVILPNGDYAYGNAFVTRGSQSPVIDGFGDFISDAPTVSFKDLEGYGSTFALFDFDGDMLGVFVLSSNITISNTGYSCRAVNYLTGAHVAIHALYNRNSFVERDPTGLVLVPAHSIVVLLGKDRTDEIEIDPNSAQLVQQYGMNNVLNDRMRVTYDGSEFWVNGMPVPDEPTLAKHLVMGESLSPEHARTFIKKAMEKGEVTILMSKKANFTGSFPSNEIPTWGQERNKDENRPRKTDGKSFVGASNAYGKLKYDEDNRLIPPMMLMDPIWERGLQNSIFGAAETSDETAIENSIMAQLLGQMPKDVVLEYLPDLATGIDRMGRILFVFRLNIKQLTVTRPASQVNSLIQAMRASFRNLGDSYLNLLYYTATADGDQEVVEA